MVIEKVDAVRQRNFHILFEQYKADLRKSLPGQPDRGMLKKFAEHLDINSVYMSNINKGHKVIGVKTARQIEEKMGLPEGWLDTDHSRTASEMPTDDAAFLDSVMAVYRQAPEASRALLLRAFQALITGKPLGDALHDELAAHDKTAKNS